MFRIEHGGMGTGFVFCEVRVCNPRRSTLLATLILLSLFVLGCRGPSVNGSSITSWEEPGALKGGVSDLAAWDGSFYLLSFHRSSPGRALGVLQSYDGDRVGMFVGKLGGGGVR